MSSACEKNPSYTHKKASVFVHSDAVNIILQAHQHVNAMLKLSLISCYLFLSVIASP